MRIVIDLQGAQTGSRHRGIGRYSIALAQAMVKHKGNHEILIALNGLFRETIEPIRGMFEGLLPQENIRVWNAVGPVHAFDPSNSFRKSSAEFVREAFLASLQPDIVHITSLMEGFGDDGVHSIGRAPKPFATALTFYDAIPLIQSDVYLKPNLYYQQPYYEKLNYMEKADIFFAISESSRQEAIDFIYANPKQVINIGAAADKHFRPLTISEDAEVSLRKKFGLKKHYIMYSGATDERKNHLGLIKAYSLLSKTFRKKYQLALVGGLPEDHKERFRGCAEECGLSSADVVITDRVTDDELLKLYNLCDLYVFPSWHEGFGLPALEAMSCGAAVIAANTTSLPEVIGRNDALFDPTDPVKIAAKISEVLGDPDLLKSLKVHGLKQAKKFSWDKSARKALNAIEAWHMRNGKLSNNDKRQTDIPPWLIPKIERLPGFCPENEDWINLKLAIRQNHPNRATKNLFVDVCELVQRDSKSGIQRVVRSILLKLLKDPPKGYVVKPVYATTDRYGYYYADRFTAKFLDKPIPVEADLPVDYAQGDVFLGLDMQHYVIPKHQDYYQDLRNKNVAVYFLIHDLLPVLRPEYFPQGTMNDHERWLLTMAEVADGVVCVSKTVADELYTWLNERNPQRHRPLMIGWSHNGADIAKSAPSRGLPENSIQTLKLLRARTTFVSVGTIEPRKGYGQMLEAFELLWKQGCDVNLAFVGKQGWNVETLHEKINRSPQLGKRLFWFDGVSDEYLQKIYESSDCLIAASEGEGFGLPVVEAAQKGISVIARDIPVFREVAGNQAIYFNGMSPQDLESCVVRWLKLKNEGKLPDVKKMKWLNWDQSTKSLLNVILGHHWYRTWSKVKM